MLWSLPLFSVHRYNKHLLSDNALNFTEYWQEHLLALSETKKKLFPGDTKYKAYQCLMPPKGYGFQGNYGSVWTYWSFQFQMDKNGIEIWEFEMHLKNSFLFSL